MSDVGRPAGLPFRQICPVPAAPFTPAEVLVGGALSGAPQYSSDWHVPLRTVALSPTMLTCRSATCSVVTTREPFDRTTTSPRCTVSSVLTVPSLGVRPLTEAESVVSVIVYVSLSDSPEQLTAWAPRSAVQVGKPVGVKNGKKLPSAEVEPGSPIGTVRLTRPPVGLAMPVPGGWKARLSLEVQVAAVACVTVDEVGSSAASLCVLQK